MAAEDARLKASLKNAEDELNLIKNQIQQTLLDIREHILDVTNPFTDLDSILTDEDEMEIEDFGGDGMVEEQSGSGEEQEFIDEEDQRDEEVSVEGDDIVETIVEEDAPPDHGGDEIVEEDFTEPEDDFGSEELFEEELPEESFEMDDVEEDETEEFFEEEPAEVEEEPVEEEPEMVSIPEEKGDELLAATPDSIGSMAAALSAELDLVTMASLVRWVALTRHKLGQPRLDVLLDAYELAGRISPQVKAVLRSLSALADEDPDGLVPVRDVVSAMVRMEGVLSSRANADSNKLLGLLLEIDEDPLDKLLI